MYSRKPDHLKPMRKMGTPKKIFEKMGPTGFDSETNGIVSMSSYGNDARKFNIPHF